MMTQENIPYTADEIKAMVKTCEKYNKALERASKLRVQNPFDTVGQMVEHIFPELVESEDEKIRKRLIKTFGSIVKEQWGGIAIEDILAWLKKQGEHKPIKASYTTIVETGNGGINALVKRDLFTDGCYDEKNPSDKVEPKTLNADKVIAWLEDQACLGWIEDVEVHIFVDKFKKDFGL